MSDEKSENLHEWYAIKFCVKVKKMVTEMKEMIDTAYNESTMSRPAFIAVTSLKVVGRVWN